jgi:hypothetical protein
MAHDPWDFVTIVPPMTHGKMSLKGLDAFVLDGEVEEALALM